MTLKREYYLIWSLHLLRLSRLRIWEQLGYQIDRETKRLIPPPLNTSETRQMLLRAWVELSAYTADFHRAYRQYYLLECQYPSTHTKLQRKTLPAGTGTASSYTSSGSKPAMPVTILRI